MCFTLYSAIVNHLWRQYAADEKMATVDAHISAFRDDRLKETNYAQHLWSKMLRCGSLYTKKRLKALFVKVVSNTIRRTIQLWRP